TSAPGLRQTSGRWGPYRRASPSPPRRSVCAPGPMTSSCYRGPSSSGEPAMFLANALRRMRPRAVRSHGGSRHAHGQRSRVRPLVLESLEDRCLLSAYSFALLADDGPNSPFDFSHPLLGGVPAMSDQATAYVLAGLKSGGEGAFTRDAQGHLGIIAITSDLIRDFPIGGGINNAGTVSFGADLRDGTQAIFTGRG